MPYHIEPADHGYYVVGPSGRKSKKPLSMTMAKKQRTAINISQAHSPMISMPIGEFKKEHKRLVKTLEEGSKAKRMGEAHRQMMEMRERLG